jgi:hypothetical protein
MFSPLSGRLLAAVLATGLCAPLVYAQPAANPFAKVPALPTACYTKGETLYPKLEAAKAAVTADMERQDAINDKIAEDFNSIDPMEKAAKMQQWMMSNPQEAMKYMQGVQAAGTAESQAEVAEDAKTAAKFDAEQKSLLTRYEAALIKAYAPADARFDVLAKKVVAEQGCGFGDGECGVPPWAQAEYEVIQREKDAAYVATCPQWWGATGQITAYMKRYKDWLTQKHVPYLESLEVHVTNQYAIMNTPAASYRSIEPYKAANKYIDAASVFYQARDEEPRCGPKGCK